MSKENITSNWIDPDDAPPLTREYFDRAEIRKGDTILRRGRPKSLTTKQPVSLRLDQDVVEWFKSSGEGWQTRINSELRKVAGI
jgi:uncharacterized protein (DUF4415 family)